MIQIGTKKALDNYLLFRKNFQGDEERILHHLIAAYLGITPTQLSSAGSRNNYPSRSKRIKISL
jgi:hypothetical protein